MKQARNHSSSWRTRLPGIPTVAGYSPTRGEAPCSRLASGQAACPAKAEVLSSQTLGPRSCSLSNSDRAAMSLRWPEDADHAHRSANAADKRRRGQGSLPGIGSRISPSSERPIRRPCRISFSGNPPLCPAAFSESRTRADYPQSPHPSPQSPLGSEPVMREDADPGTGWLGSGCGAAHARGAANRAGSAGARTCRRRRASGRSPGR